MPQDIGYSGLYNVEDPLTQGSDEVMGRHLMQIYGPVEGMKIFNDFLLKRAQARNKNMGLKFKEMK